MKILIAVPCMDMVPVAFCHSLAQLQKVGDCYLTMKAGSLIYTSRNSLATEAIKSEADYVFWLDSDMVFPADTLVRMMDILKKNDLDILTGLYFRRVAPFSPVLFDKLEINGVEAAFTEFETIPDKLFEVGACGFGCVLMRTECLYDIGGKYGGVWFTPMNNAGEDCSFCIRAREEGYHIFLDPSIACGHMGYAAVTKEFYEATKGGSKE